MNLNKIDFSDGIRPEEIQENFEMIQDQINRERLGVGGYGLSYGFDITPYISDTDFYIIVNEASIVNESGEELYVPSTKIDIDLPELYTTVEHVSINYNNNISLKHIPYSVSRKKPSEYVHKDPKFSGIYINYPSNNYNTDDYIRVSNISGTILTITGAINREVVVRYSYTADRIDLVYLKNDNTVAICKGSTSSSPSYPAMPADGKYIIAYLMIESRYMDENHLTPQAYMYVREDATSKRNLYTDKNNDLWLCGTKFDDLQIIHMTEPKKPAKNTLWLSTADNTLYCWRSTDSFAYRNEIGIEKDFVDSALRDFSTYMDFKIDNNELEVYHNGNKLLKNVHYYEIYDDEASFTQIIPEGTKGNIFRIVETPSNGLKLKAGDKISYIINYKDSHYMWIPVNKMSYINAKNYRVYCTSDYAPDGEIGYFDSSIARAMGGDDYEYKYQYFIFHKDKDLEMHFTPGRNELSVLINQMVLHNDQFEELTAKDFLDMDPEHPVRRAAASFYGWTTNELSKLMEDYDSIGIGFKLVEPLDSGFNANSQPHYMADGSNDLYVEAIVEHRVCATPMKRKFQRSATFVAEETLKVNEEIKRTGVIELPDNEYYRYNENQLEVYLNGQKLNGPSVFGLEPDYIEEFGAYLQSTSEGEPDTIFNPIDEEYPGDQSYFLENKARMCTKFKLLRNFVLDDIITYRITTNVYSYDHIDEILENLETKIDVDLRSSIATKEELVNYKTSIEERVSEAESRVVELHDRIENINNSNSSIDKYTVLSMSNMPQELIQTAIASLNHINTSVSLSEGTYQYALEDTNIKATDYLTLIIRRSTSGHDHYMIPTVDYSITNVDRTNSYALLTLNDLFEFETGDVVYITGLRLGNGR